MTREEAIKYGIEWLKDEYLDAKDGAFIRIALEALEQEPCEDAVSRKIITSFLSGLISDDTERMKALKYINGLPSVNPQPKMGYWIATEDGFECSECGCISRSRADFCQYCEAKMVEPQERSDKE